MSRHPNISVVAAVGIVALLLCDAVAHAEEDEWHVGVQGAASSVSMDVYGTTGSVLGVGGGLSLGFGPREWLDVALAITYQSRTDITLDDPQIDGVFSNDLTLYADGHWIEAAVVARLVHIGGRPAFFTVLHPTLELRGGVTARSLRGAQVFNAAGGLLAEPSNESDIVPFAGARAGLTYRWSDHLQVGLLAGGSAGTRGHRAFGTQLELSWQTYSLF